MKTARFLSTSSWLLVFFSACAQPAPARTAVLLPPPAAVEAECPFAPAKLMLMTEAPIALEALGHERTDDYRRVPIAPLEGGEPSPSAQ